MARGGAGLSDSGGGAGRQALSGAEAGWWRRGSCCGGGERTAVGSSFCRGAVASYFWAQHPFSLGSYACAKVGQYTSFLPLVKTPELNGRLLFAGEHTEPDFLGTMNGAVMSGNRAAMELLMQPAP